MAEIKVEDVVEYFKPLLSTSTSCRKLSVHILGYKVGTVINRNIKLKSSYNFKKSDEPWLQQLCSVNRPISLN